MIQAKTDEELIILIRKGNILAFETVVKRYQQKLLGFVLRYVRSEAVAEEVVQDTFFTIYTKIDAIDPKRKFSSFLFTVAKNAGISAMRKVKQTVALPEDVHAGEPGAIDRLIRKDQASGVRRALGAISPLQRKVVEMYYFDELSYKDISGALKLPLNTVRTHLHRAKRALKDIFYEKD